jgi:hypothetical protein
MSSLVSALIILAIMSNGLLAGASLDQSLKQLPARKRIGPVAYSVYSEAADLGTGIAFYAILGIGAAVLSFAAAMLVLRGSAPAARAPAVLAGLLAVLHSAVTTQAAPIVFHQRQAGTNAEALAQVFDRFARWQGIRCVLQVANFGVLLWLEASFSWQSAGKSLLH